MLERLVLHGPEKFNRTGIGTGPTAFNEINAESVKFKGNTNPVVHGEIEILCLGAVPQRCIVYVYLMVHLLNSIFSGC